MPDRDDGQEWHRLTVIWWYDIWHSPMAEEYLRADTHALYRLAVLVDLFWRTPGKELASEIRLQQQAFGLTPLDRRRLEWTIEQAEAAQDRTNQRRSRTQTERSEMPGGQQEVDPRKILKMVG